jgi:hypothetical protein
MSRTEKLSKLGNAIREYRGVYNPTNGKWKRPPNERAAGRVLLWMERLGVREPIPALGDIQEFKSFDEMNKWMTNLAA